MIYLLLGIFVGFLSGLLGIGGGVLIAPALVFIFQKQALFVHHMTQIAAGSSLAVIAFTSLASIIAYQQRKSIDWNLIKRLLPGIICGALIGTLTATLVPSKFLAHFLGFFVLCIAIQMLLPENRMHQGVLPNAWILALFGVLIGIIGGLVGIGGGILLLPLLTYYQIPIRFAAGTVITCTFFVALTSILSLTIIPRVLPQANNGYIFWPVVWQIVPTSIFFVWVGAFVAHRLPVVIIRQIFAGFLAIIGGYLILLT